MVRNVVASACVAAAVAAGACATTPANTDATTTTTPAGTHVAGGANTSSSHGNDDGRAPADPEISAEAYRSVLEGEIKLQGGDVPGGIQLLREAVMHDPQSPYLHVRLAEAYLESGDAEQARASAQDALAINRKYVPAWRIVGAAWSVAGDHGAARKAFLEALKAAPGDRDASMMLAELNVEDGDLKGAEDIIERLMQKEPGAVDGYIALARVFAERGEVERAFNHVARALDRESSDTDALALKLTLLWGLGKFDDALPVAKSLAAAAGDGPEVRRELLSATVLAGKAEEADALAKAWLDDDGSEQMRLLVADAYERAGDSTRAIAAIGTTQTKASARAATEVARLRMNAHQPDLAVAAICPLVDAPSTTNGDPTVAAYAASTCSRALVRVHKPKDAAAVIEKRLNAPNAAAPAPSTSSTTSVGSNGVPPLVEALSLVAKAGGIDAKAALSKADAVLAGKETDADVVMTVARAHEELGDIERGRSILDDALRARPKDPDLLFALARHLERQKQPLPAVEIVERLMDRGKKGIDELNFVAFTLAEAGVRTDDAKKLAWRAVVQDPLNGYVVDTLGWCELMAGDVDKAVVTLKRAERLAPDEGEVLFHLAAALERKGEKKAALETAAHARAVLDEDDPVRPRVEALVDKLKKAGA